MHLLLSYDDSSELSSDNIVMLRCLVYGYITLAQAPEAANVCTGTGRKRRQIAQKGAQTNDFEFIE